ncbi:MAG: lipid asymmetry maintenance protein MlaB [Alkalispirochaeta sp.]
MSANVKIVNLGGRITLPRIEEINTLLKDEIDASPAVLVSLSRAEEIDLAGVQLLYAARRYANSRERTMHITGTVPEAIAERLYRSGFTSSIIRDGKELDENLHEFDVTAVAGEEDRTDA